MEEEWNRLADIHESPLLRHEWFYSCYRAFHKNDKICILVKRTNGCIKGIAPLVLTGKGWNKKIEAIGSSFLYEPTGLLYGKDSIASELIRAALDLGLPLELKKFHKDSAEIKTLVNIRKKLAIIINRGEDRTSYISFKESGEEYEKWISKSRNRDIRRKKRKAESYGKAEFEFFKSSPIELNHFLEEFFQIEASGWKARKGTAIRLNPDMKNFFYEYCKKAAESGLIRFCYFKVNQKIVAASLLCESYGKLWELKIAYDEKFRKCSPGMLLTFETLRFAEDNRLKGYEFLGETRNREKIFTNKEHYYASPKIYPYTFRAC